MMTSSFKLPTLAAAANQLLNRNRFGSNEGYNNIPKGKKPKSDLTPIVVRRSLRTQGLPPDSIKTLVSSSVTTTEPPRKLGPIVSMGDVFDECQGNNKHQKQQHLIHTIKGLSEKAPLSLMSCSINQKSDDGAGSGGGGDGSVIDPRSLILKPKNVARILPAESQGVLNLKFFPCKDRSLIVTGNKDGNVAFWDVDKDAEDDNKDDNGIYLYGPHASHISGITIRPFSLSKIRLNHVFHQVDHERAVHSAYFSPSGSCLATTCSSNKVGLLGGVDFMDIYIISHEYLVGRVISFFRAIWGWDDSYLFIGNKKKGVDVISTSSHRKMVTLESPHISVNSSQLATHPYKVGTLAGVTTGGWVYVWVSQLEV